MVFKMGGVDMEFQIIFAGGDWDEEVGRDSSELGRGGGAGRARDGAGGGVGRDDPVHGG